MKFVVPCSNVATGLNVEEKSFTWTIDNFPFIRMRWLMIESQKIYFSAGSTVGFPHNWSIFLQESTIDGKKWIGIYFNAEPPTRAANDDWKYIHMQMVFETEGAVVTNGETDCSLHHFYNCGRSSFGLPNFIEADPAGASTEEKLVIKLTFRVYAPSKPDQSCQSTVEEFQVRFKAQAWEDLAHLLKDPVPFQSIKVISRDKVEFSAQKEILAARSPVFKAMLESDMIEANSGVIELPDISSAALQVLLAFLSTGELLPEWSGTEVIVELTNAAAKYQLQDLLQFLDVAMGKVCKLENVVALATLARQLSLKVAAKGLLNFAKEQGVGSLDNLIQMFSSELTGTEDESDEPQAKKQKSN